VAASVHPRPQPTVSIVSTTLAATICVADNTRPCCRGPARRVRTSAASTDLGPEVRTRAPHASIHRAR
jgi:hypothetical protein